MSHKKKERRGTNPADWKQLPVTEYDVKSLLNLLAGKEGAKRHLALIRRLEGILDDFKHGLAKLRELEKTAISNGFFEQDKTANMVSTERGKRSHTIKELTQGIACLEAEAMRQLELKNGRGS